MRILVNHLGYERDGFKKAVIEGAPDAAELQCSIVSKDTGREVFSGTARKAGRVPGWKTWSFHVFDFSAFTGEGRFFVRLDENGTVRESEPFAVGTDLLVSRTLSDILFYYKTSHCSGRFDRRDRSVPFYGSDRAPVDVHGGWYDASGDTSKYLSHLSYTNYMNPQQTPIVVWALLEAFETLDTDRSPLAPDLRERFIEETLQGADYLVRMQDPEGYFYTTVFDRWTKLESERMICAYSTQQGIRSDRYRAAWRQGGGVAVAALARTAAAGLSGDYPAHRYLEAAELGFSHLGRFGSSYADDGVQNIIDDYCALLAASELFGATGRRPYLEAARDRADRLVARLSLEVGPHRWWRADEGGEIPFFHAVEAGFPVVALLRFLELCGDAAGRRLDPAPYAAAVRDSLRAELALTGSVVNPFGYARQFVKPLSGPPREAFFIPKDNWSGYWWQGENARIASLAAAARKTLRVLYRGRKIRTGAADAGPAAGAPVGSSFDAGFPARLERYAADQTDWILGLNPYDSCMLTGHGRNNVEYERAWRNAPGGIVNGVTSAFAGEDGIDFMPEPYASDSFHRWRWSEQWIPHAAWFILALTERGR